MKYFTATVLLLFVAACSNNGGPSSSSADKGPLACTVLSRAELSAAVGAAVSSGDPGNDSDCTFTFRDGNASIIIHASASDADTQWAGNNIANTLMHNQPKSGPKVGDDSYWEIPGEIFYARKGKGYVGIDMRGAPIKNTEDVGPQLAAKALARL